MKYRLILSLILTSLMATSYSQSAEYNGVHLDSNEETSDIRTADYIDKEGRSGTVTGAYSSAEIENINFASETEIGSYSESFIYADGMLERVEITEVQFNRPKFWSQSVAKSNGDNEWYDPDKSVTAVTTYYFKGGVLEYWENSDGSEGHPINKQLKKIGPDLMDRAELYRQLLEK
ncbi:hypothetical protein [Fulvivirga sedimenti]|uniref:Uncharacterized protein n=1 Tax=Fulvivirga sedimenti TaxID=2879465 RepID=A0A9X1KZB2_9BACT|nr:hypothetical protein [Fulvivirga sedimenti]MCA6078723.1 hypothetical protein [Fulvivirga sedimenti]